VQIVEEILVVEMLRTTLLKTQLIGVLMGKKGTFHVEV